MRVTGCPCGEAHQCDAEMWLAYRKIVKDLPDTVVVSTPTGSWQVPRLYIAMHGLRAEDIAALAARHGWQQP